MNIARGVRTVILSLPFFTPLSVMAATYQAFDTGNGSELITSSGVEVKRIVFSVDVGTLSAGDIIVATTEAELTTKTGNVARVTSQLIRGTTATATSGVELDEATATNNSEDIYHVVLVKHAINTVTAGNAADHFVNFYVDTAEDMTVNQDYGRLQIMVIHP